MTSKPFVLDHIPFPADEALIIGRLGPGAAQAVEEIRALIRDAGRIARPKAAFTVCDAASIDGSRVVINGVSFDSRLLAQNLKDAHRVFPFVVTCGRELADWTAGISDPLSRYWAEGLAELAMSHARQRLMDHLGEAYGLGKASTMNPGSLPDWPLSQQGPLFSLIGDVEGAIGVTLTESFLMHPVKSVSGIRFPREADWENCMLCPREACKGRRAPYDPGMRERFKDAINA